ncbi:cupin domain-containing protein [bacterium]|nr:MAG: cupin domain-containing protein [bacterium]
MWNRNDLHDLREALFGGEGVVRVWVVPTAVAPPFTVALACELDPAGRVGVHVQTDDAEVVIVVEGEGVAVVDGEPRSIEPGSVTALPLGSRLALDNASPSAPLRYLIVKARPTTS